MEFCKGGCLNEEVFPVCVSTALISKLGSDLLSAIKVLHQNNIFHRDIKPKNIFISTISIENNPTFKLGDFGLSRFLDSHQTASKRCGSSEFMTPEQLSGNSYNKFADFKSLDIFMQSLCLNNHFVKNFSLKGVFNDKKIICSKIPLLFSLFSIKNIHLPLKYFNMIMNVTLKHKIAPLTLFYASKQILLYCDLKKCFSILKLLKKAFQNICSLPQNQFFVIYYSIIKSVLIMIKEAIKCDLFNKIDNAKEYYKVALNLLRFVKNVPYGDSLEKGLTQRLKTI